MSETAPRDWTTLVHPRFGDLTLEGELLMGAGARLYIQDDRGQVWELEDTISQFCAAKNIGRRVRIQVSDARKE